MIIGEVKGQSGRRTADDLFDIGVLRGANAAECQTSEVIFSKKSERPIFYRRDIELGYKYQVWGQRKYALRLDEQWSRTETYNSNHFINVQADNVSLVFV